MEKIHKEMIEKGVKNGTLVELMLESDAQMFTDSTHFFVIPKENPAESPESKAERLTQKVYAGYVSKINDESIILVSGWDKDKQRVPVKGNIGGAQFYWEAIQSYRIL